MGRLIFVPQFPVPMRYQEWWYTEFPKQFESYFDEVIVLGKSMIENSMNKDMSRDIAMFSPIEGAINFELFQIMEYMNMKIYPFEDTLFLSDLSFPGFFTNALHHKRIRNSYAYCHATSLNNLDYFEVVRNSKWFVELGQSKMFKTIFVGSGYHRKKLTDGWTAALQMSNISVVGLPNPPLKTYYGSEKKIDIISVSRPTSQKVNLGIEELVERNFGKIVRKECKSWEEYYKFVASAKIMLVSSSEETYGYQVVDAILNGTIPITPRNFSYPELIGTQYMYENYNELENKIIYYLKRYNEVPDLYTKKQADSFYDKICERMKK